jgi:hypothetical protein
VPAIAADAAREQARQEGAGRDRGREDAGRDRTAAEQHHPECGEEGERLAEGHRDDVEDVLQTDVRRAPQERDPVRATPARAHDLASGRIAGSVQSPRNRLSIRTTSIE